MRGDTCTQEESRRTGQDLGFGSWAMSRAHVSGLGDNGGRYAGAALGRGKVCTKAHYLGLRREKRAQGVGAQVYWVCVFV